MTIYFQLLFITSILQYRKSPPRLYQTASGTRLLLFLLRLAFPWRTRYTPPSRKQLKSPSFYLSIEQNHHHEGISEVLQPALGRGCLLIATSTFNYGFDNQGFATTQAMDAFTRRFGVKAANGTYALDGVWLSLFSSLIYIGFGVGRFKIKLQDYETLKERLTDCRHHLGQLA